MKSTCRLVTLVAFVLAGTYSSSAPLRAQTVSGTILGLVQDPQGAAIPKADAHYPLRLTCSG